MTSPRDAAGQLTRLAGLVCVGLLVTRCGTPSHVNTVARYLTGAELQAEDDGQRREIARALDDMIQRSTPELRTRRYADYQGRASAWSVTDVLQHYFVPREPMTLESQRFYEDVGQAEARAAIQQQLDRVRSRLRDER